MLSGNDVYRVLSSMLPLYIALLAGYGSIRWWRIFSPEQCTGINRYVSYIAVPTLGFQIIAQTNLYHVNYQLILADMLSKVVFIAVLVVWAFLLGPRGGSPKWVYDWCLTAFVTTTMPNTLVVGMKILTFLSCQVAIWYTFVLVLFNLRAAQQHSFQVMSARFSPESAPAQGEVLPELATLGEVSSVDQAGIRAGGKAVGDASEPGAAARETNSRARTMDGNLEGDSCVVAIRVADSLGEAPGKNSSGFDLELAEREDAVGGKGGTQATDPAGMVDGATGVPGVSELVQSPARPQMLGASSELEMPIVNALKQATLQVPVTCEPSNGSRKEPAASTGHRPPSLGKLHGRAMWKLTMRILAYKIATNPNVGAVLLGVVYSFLSFGLDFGMPKVLRHSVTIIANTGLGMAMFSMGMFMANQHSWLPCGWWVLTWTSALKFVASPALTAGAAVVLTLRHTSLKIAIVQAALPQGIVGFVWANEYNLQPEVFSTGVIVGTLISFPILLLYYILLGI